MTHNLLICCGPIPPGGTVGCCDGRYAKPKCWCGGDVGPRIPGDAWGFGCLSDITHRWEGQ